MVITSEQSVQLKIWGYGRLQFWLTTHSGRKVFEIQKAKSTCLSICHIKDNPSYFALHNYPSYPIFTKLLFHDFYFAEIQNLRLDAWGWIRIFHRYFSANATNICFKCLLLWFKIFYSQKTTKLKKNLCGTFVLFQKPRNFLLIVIFRLNVQI